MEQCVQRPEFFILCLKERLYLANFNNDTCIKSYGNALIMGLFQKESFYGCNFCFAETNQIIIVSLEKKQNSEESSAWAQSVEF